MDTREKSSSSSLIGIFFHLRLWMFFFAPLFPANHFRSVYIWNMCGGVEKTAEAAAAIINFGI